MMKTICCRWNRKTIAFYYKKEFGNKYLSCNKYLSFRLILKYLPSMSQIYKWFGSWSSFMESMGLCQEKPIRWRFILDKQDCFDSYKRAVSYYKNKKRLTKVEYYRAGMSEKLVSFKTIEKNFKSWNNFNIEFCKFSKCVHKKFIAA